MAKDFGENQPFHPEGPARQKVLQALGEAGSIPSRFEERFREPYINPRATLFLPRVAYFERYDEETLTPIATPENHRGLLNKKPLPEILADESALKSPAELAASLRTLDTAAEALTSFFINGGVLREGFIQPDSELGIEVLRQNLGNPRGDVETTILDTDPRLKNSGYLVEPNRDRFGNPRASSVTVIFPESARNLSYDRNSDLRIPREFDGYYRQIPELDGKDPAPFWIELARSVNSILVDGELGQNNWPVRILDKGTIEELYHYKSATSMMMHDVLTDIINARPGLYPKKPFLPFRGLRRFFPRPSSD